MSFKVYFKNNLIQILSIITKIITLLLVTPHISSDRNYFAIYSYGITLISFINYADFGFFRASQKFASEYVGGNKINLIYKSIGFGTFVTLIFSFLFSFFFIIISIFPQFAISNISGLNQFQFARKYFILITLSIPITIIHRMLLTYYDINFKSYRFYIFSIISNILILSFSTFLIYYNHFTIIFYFTFLQIINAFLCLVLIFDLKKTFKYSVTKILKNIKFSRSEFLKSKNIATATLVSMLSWLVFYEIDLIFLAKIYSLEQISYYSLSLIILGLFRTFTGVIFSNFNVKINNLIGRNDNVGYLNFTSIYLYFTAPIILYITFAYTLLSNKFIILWVGENYNESSNISIYLVIGYSLSFFSYITSSLLLSKNRVKEIMFISILQPLIFWATVFLFYKNHGIYLVSILKCIVLLLTDIFYLYYFLKITNLKLKDIIYKIFLPFVIISPILFFIIKSIDFLPIYNYNSKLVIFIIFNITTALVLMTCFIHYKVSKVNLNFIKLYK
jgi:O-antigen/teichoic acid export membrane protein